MYAVGMKIWRKVESFKYSVNAANADRKTQTAVFHIVNSCLDNFSSVFRGSTDVSSRFKADTTCTTSGDNNAFGDVGRFDGNGSRSIRNVLMNGDMIIRGMDACGTLGEEVDRGRDMVDDGTV